MSKHTPPARAPFSVAPWAVSSNGIGDWKVTDADGDAVAAYSAVYPECCISIGLEDAHLIAAAPSLLSALEAVEWGGHEVVEVCPECRIDKIYGHAVDCALSAALLLARGESPTTETQETK